MSASLAKRMVWQLVIAIWLVHASSSFAARTPFFDYDCISVQDQLMDYDELYRGALAAIHHAERLNGSPGPPSQSGRLLVNHAERLLRECPLGLLYLALTHFFASLFEPPEKEGREAMMQHTYGLVQLAAEGFPIHTICSSRWPIFEALMLYSARAPVDNSLTCDSIEDGVVDWALLRRLSNQWALTRWIETLGGAVPLSDKEKESLELEVSKLIHRVLRKVDRSRLECPRGTLFAVLSQVLSSSTRTTQHFTFFSMEVDDTFSEVGLLSTNSSGWPIYDALTWISDVNKGERYVERDMKYLRKFGDLDLLPVELAPMAGAPPPVGVDRGDAVRDWRRRISHSATSMARLPWRSFACAVNRRASWGKIGIDDGPQPRPIIRRMLLAILEVAGVRQGTKHVPSAAECVRLAATDPKHRRGRPRRGRARRRRAVALMLLYGQKWSTLLPRVIRRLESLGFMWPIFVVSIGNAAVKACRAARDRGLLPKTGQQNRLKIACWEPNTKSQVHRFTITHVLLHLGIDVFYFDFDTFFLRDPLPMVLGRVQRDRLDALFASHADGDCINIGLFFLRATSRSAPWFSQFLQWYHDHQYEIDQRGLDVLLGSPMRQSFSDLGVSYPPQDLVQIRAGALEDVNDVVIGFIGWAGQVGRMFVFHWCNLPLERKWKEIAIVYEAAEAIEGKLPFALAMSAVSPQTPADNSTWSLVLQAWSVFEAYRKPAPPLRTYEDRCW